MQQSGRCVKAHGVVWPAAGQAALEEFEVADPGPGELLLRAEYSLISPGTERAFFLGLPNTAQTYPQRPGYAFIGTVAAAGPGVDFQRGERVMAPAPHATHSVVNASTVVPVPPDVDPESAAFLGLGLVAMMGMRRGRIELGEAVAVLGQGVVGLLAAQLAKLQGGMPVIGLDFADSRLAVSRACGVDITINAEDREGASGLFAALPGRGAAVVIEASGEPEAIPRALQLTARFGRMVALGSTRDVSTVNFYEEVHRKGAVILGAHASTRPRESRAGSWNKEDDVRVFWELVRRDRLKLEPIITHRLAGQEAPGAYQLLKAWDPGLLGVILRWRESAPWNGLVHLEPPAPGRGGQWPPMGRTSPAA